METYSVEMISGVVDSYNEIVGCVGYQNPAV